jgi:Protein of unknown function (DUF2612)
VRTVADYLDKVTSLHRKQPDYNAMLAMVLQPFSDLQAFLRELPQQFDVDVAIGAQLDVVGLWVGVTRNIPVPDVSPFFSLDDPNLARGFDKGIWKGPYTPGTTLSALGDDDFRRVIKARIAANSWDCTIPSANSILAGLFAEWPNTFVFMEDRGDSPLQTNFFTLDDISPLRGFDEGMWYQPGETAESLLATDMLAIIAVSGQIPSIVLLEVLAQGMIPLKPVGVRTPILVTSVDGPIFGLDVDNTMIGGFDHGAWGVDPNLLPSL